MTSLPRVQETSGEIEAALHVSDVLCGRVHSPQAVTILVAAGRSAFAR